MYCKLKQKSNKLPTQGLAPCEHKMRGFTDRAATTYGFMSAYTARSRIELLFYA